MELIRDNVKVEWVSIGEGLHGNYNPNNPDDLELLRFYVSVLRNGVWEEKEDASYCTNFPASATREEKLAGLEILLNRFYDALSDDIDASVKKLGEELSWIGLNSIPKHSLADEIRSASIRAAESQPSEIFLFEEDKSGNRMGKPDDRKNSYYAKWFEFYTLGLDGTPHREASSLNFYSGNQPVSGGNGIGEADVIESFRQKYPASKIVVLSIDRSPKNLAKRMADAVINYKNNNKALLVLPPYMNVSFKKNIENKRSRPYRKKHFYKVTCVRSAELLANCPWLKYQERDFCMMGYCEPTPQEAVSFIGNPIYDRLYDSAISVQEIPKEEALRDFNMDNWSNQKVFGADKLAAQKNSFDVQIRNAKIHAQSSQSDDRPVGTERVR